MIPIFALLTEKPFESVNRAVKQAVINNKPCELNIYGEKFVFTTNDTEEHVTNVKIYLNKKSRLLKIEAKLSK